ncbi:amino acid permease [Pontibacillus chungwhensis BH030062]|uniref:Amino acid permease n=1 Tax=Pontibacillus chungwhensis BH030062 TaxID=1385513 RepID=A0A0A2UT10_9BACI|nr:APC family permease [Pontibacillus chungwhensis]KGP91422.1 amino acid permease [Pontibacillus chungwhensis BH030062]
MGQPQRKKLDKTLKPHWVWAIAFGSAVGWGAFVLPTDWLQGNGPLPVVIGFLLGAILMTVIGVSYGYLIKQFPVSGGEFAYAYIGFGRTHAFVAGWFLTLGYICTVALNSSALALLGKFLFPSVVKVVPLYTIAGWDVYLGEIIISTVTLIVFAFLNIRGASFSGRSQFIFTMVLLSGVILLAIGAIVSDQATASNMQPLIDPSKPAIASILAIVAITPWAYLGFDNIPQAAEEFDFPPNKAFKLIVYALLAAGLAYSVMVLTVSSLAPWQELAGSASAWATGDAIDSIFGRLGIFIIATALIMGIFTGLNGFYLSSSRLMFAMGRARVLPQMFHRLHPKYNTPYVGIIFTSILCLIAPWFGREVLLWIVDMSSIGVTIAYFYCCATAFRMSTSKVQKTFATLGIISAATFFFLLTMWFLDSSLSAPSYIALAVWAGLGLLFYLFKQKEYNAIPRKELNYLITEKEEIPQNK